MKKMTLNQKHTCKCTPCIKIPRLFIRGKNTRVSAKHSCGCKACMQNIKDLQRNKITAKSSIRHTCNCNACEENQKMIKQWRKNNEKIQMSKPRL